MLQKPQLLCVQGWFKKGGISEMDLAKPKLQVICHELISQADIVVENFSSGVIKRHKLNLGTLKK